MLETILIAVISAVTGSIGAILGGFIISKRLKNGLKADIIEFFESEDAPKLIHAIGQSFGAGIFSRAGALNPMKGNINILGFKIPKVLAFGAAQKFGFLPDNMMGQGEAAPTSPTPPHPLEKFR